MKKFYFITLIIVLLSSSHAQDTSITNYMPMAMGNVWVYQVSGMVPMCGCDKYIQTKITGTVIKNARTYYLFQNTEKIIMPCNCGCLYSIFDTNRVDPVSGNVYAYSVTGCSYSPFEIMIDSLRASLNDTIRTLCSTSYVTCYNTDSVILFGMKRASRRFTGYWGSPVYGYVKGIGYTGAWTGGEWGTCITTFLGCVINGVVYGDTSFTLVGVQPSSSEIPKEFNLFQNYPNPFNPTTKIRFNIAPLLNQGGVAPTQVGDGVVFLKIYDLLGREITTLVNQTLQPGTYEVEWDASNYPSGVYFYKLTAGSYMSTKKLVLLK